MLTSASQAMIATQSVFMSLAMLTVGLRLYLRIHTSPPLRADDYLIIVALFFSVALAVTNIVGVPIGGFGVAFGSLSDETAVQYLKILFILQFFYLLAVAFVKLSVLYFYGRIFSVRHMRPIFKSLIALTLAWLAAFFFATLFQILPLECNWAACKATTNYPVMYVVCNATDIVLDIGILCLPALYIRGLRMDRERKIGMGGIFGLGVFCVVSSIARLSYTADYLSLDPTVNAGPGTTNAETNIILWSGIEACASTICANLPFYGPLIAKTRSSVPSLGRFPISVSRRNTRVYNPDCKSYERFARSPSRTRTGGTTTITCGGQEEGGLGLGSGGRKGSIVKGGSGRNTWYSDNSVRLPERAVAQTFLRDSSGEGSGGSGSLERLKVGGLEEIEMGMRGEGRGEREREVIGVARSTTEGGMI